MPEVPDTGESCQYYWTREPSSEPTPFSNTLGWCFPVQSWRYDPDGMDPINNTDPYPRCPTLTTGDVVPPISTDIPQNDAMYFGCVALQDGPPPPPAPAPPAPRRPAPTLLDRLGPFNQD